MPRYLKNRHTRLCKQVDVQFTQPDMDKIEKLAQAWGCDLSDVLRRAVRELLARQGLLSDEENELLTSKVLQR